MSRAALFFILLAPSLGARDAAQTERDLNEIARVATVMVDGDVCERIVTPRALAHLLQKDPRDEWAGGDNYDVDDRSFIATKKTLIRLAQLADYPVDANLWMPVKGAPGLIHIVIRNRYEMSQLWTWGELTQPVPPVMRAVLETGKPATVKQKPGMISVLAPVRNSRGDIVGVVEVVSRLELDPRENVK